jgi:CheY-like chemotaxis protein
MRTLHGNEALQILQRESNIDLVITDHAMPGMTGVQLTDAIQAAWPKLPVILATGYVELAEGEHIHVQRLTKPYGRAELLKAIRKAMVRANRMVIS